MPRTMHGMRILRSSLALAIACVSGCANEATDWDTTSGSLRGGTEADSRDWSSIAALYSVDGSYRCPGILVTPRWILTSAMCAWRARTAYVGRVDRPATAGADAIPLIRDFTHPVWDVYEGGPDMALMELATPAATSPIPLATEAEIAALGTGTELTIAGWGSLGSELGAPLQLRLRQATAPLMNGLACESVSGETVSNYEMCIGAAGGPIAACVGDQGGPVLARIGGRLRVVGVISHGPDGNLCDAANGITVASRLHAPSYSGHSWLEEFSEWGRSRCDIEMSNCLAESGADRCECERRQEQCAIAHLDSRPASTECCVDGCADADAACRASGTDACECERRRSVCSSACGVSAPISQGCCLAGCSSEAQGCVDIGNPYCFCARGEAACRTQCGVPTSQPRRCRGVPDPELPR